MGTFNTVEEYVAAQPEPLREIAERMQRIVDEVLPGTGAIWHGHPVWSLGPAPGRNPVCLIKAYSSHLAFGLWKGRDIADPSGRLDTGKSIAGVKLRTSDDIDAELFTGWLQQARALELADLSGNA